MNIFLVMGLRTYYTPVVEGDPGRGDVKQFDYYVRVRWNANGIGEIAQANDFDKVYYADLESLRILGIWSQEWVHVYGSRRAPEAASPPAR